MERIYKISFSNQFNQTKAKLDLTSLHLYVIFGEKDGKRYAVIAKYESSTGGKKTRNSYSWYDVYHRVDFNSAESGNKAFKDVKGLFSNVSKVCDGYYDCNDSNITVEQIISTLRRS